MISSTNRISSIKAEYSDKLLESYEEPLYLDNIEETTGYHELLESSVEIVQEELEIYESELGDVLEYESMQSLLTESTLERIVTEYNNDKVTIYFDKINNKCDKTIEKIEQAFAGLSNKFGKIFSKDKNTYDKYLKALNKPNCMEGFKGIKNFSIDISGYCKIAKDLTNPSTFKFDLKKIINAKTSADASKFLSEIKENNRKILELNIIDYDSNVVVKEPNWIPTDKDIKELVTFMDKDKQIRKFLSESCETYVKAIKNLKSQVSSNIDSVDIASTLYKACLDICNTINIAVSSLIDIEINKIMIMRKGFIVCGKYASSKLAKNESVEIQNMVNEAIMESSDEYIINKIRGGI